MTVPDLPRHPKRGQQVFFKGQIIDISSFVGHPVSAGTLPLGHCSTKAVVDKTQINGRDCPSTASQEPDIILWTKQHTVHVVLIRVSGSGRLRVAFTLETYHHSPSLRPRYTPIPTERR